MESVFYAGAAVVLAVCSAANLLKSGVDLEEANQHSAELTDIETEHSQSHSHSRQKKHGNGHAHAHTHERQQSQTAQDSEATRQPTRSYRAYRESRNLETQYLAPPTPSSSHFHSKLLQTSLYACSVSSSASGSGSGSARKQRRAVPGRSCLKSPSSSFARSRSASFASASSASSDNSSDSDDGEHSYTHVRPSKHVHFVGFDEYEE